MARDEYLSSGSQLQGTVTDLISGIRAGDIALDVPNVQAWLEQFSGLTELVAAQGQRLLRESVRVATDLSLGSFELSTQIRHKMSDRIGADGGLAPAIDEVAQALRDIHHALHSSLVTHTESDQTNADTLTRIAQGGGAPRG